MTNPMNDKDHPIWPIIRLTIMMGTLLLVLYLTASQFDQTELVTILVMFLAGAGVEGIQTMFFRKDNQ